MDTFDAHLDQWLAYREQPWARLRYAVVASALARHLPPGSRVLDVGGGDGGDALPLAAAGHGVTVVDTSRALLARAAANGLPTAEASLDALPAGEWDVVLCHLLLQYREDTVADVERLLARLRPGGLLSLLVPNDVGPVLAAAARGGPAAALAELDAPTGRTATFDTTVRRIGEAELDAALSGLDVVGRYGVRCLNEVIPDGLKADAYDDLLALELAVCDRDPFRRVALFTHVVARVPEQGAAHGPIA
ncbi:MAG: class I SAM-dependent methyltransferase [Mycobacteriales bacterium]